MGVEKTQSATSKTAPGDTKNVYKSSRKYSDRNLKSLELPPFDIKITQISSVILLLQSEEVDVVQKALNHLDQFALLGRQQLQKLHDCHLYNSVVKLCKSEDVIVKRFAFKLLVQFVTCITDCKKKLLQDDDLIEQAKAHFMTTPDDILADFSSILLHNCCDDPKQVDSLGRDDAFLKSIFNKFRSHDTDILLHSLRLLNVIMRNSMVIESVLSLKDFPVKNFQIELKNGIKQIRSAALDGFLIITNFSENPFWDVLSSERLTQEIKMLCMQTEDESIQKTALMVMLNLCKNDDVLLKLSKSGILFSFVTSFLDKSIPNRNFLLGVLMEFAKIDDNLKILRENGIVKEVVEMLELSGSLEACSAIITLATNIFCLKEILSQNVYILLVNEAFDVEKEWRHRVIALTAFHKLINIQGFNNLMEVSGRIEVELSKVLSTSTNVNFVLVAVSVLMRLAEYHEIKLMLATQSLVAAVFTAIGGSTRSTQLMVRLFNLASNFIDQESFQQAFIDSEAEELVTYNIKSTSSHLRTAVCTFVSACALYPTLSEILIQSGILKLLMESFHCTSCSDAFEMLMNHDLSIKFSIRGRLEASDKIQSGFYATKGGWVDFQRLRGIIMNDGTSPINAVYTVNYSSSSKPNVKLGNREIFRDKSLIQLIDEIKQNPNFSGVELHDKIKFLAQQVAKFFQTTDECTSHQLQLHIVELKFKFSSSVIPVGSLICGNSFEAALLFKALADQLEIDASLHTDDDTGKAWNKVCDETNVVDLICDVGEMYEASGWEARKYFQKIL